MKIHTENSRVHVKTTRVANAIPFIVVIIVVILVLVI